MKKLVILFCLALFSVANAAAQKEGKDDSETWNPVATWPFLKQQFVEAEIMTTAKKRVRTRSNIHVGKHTLWFYSPKQNQNLEAKAATIEWARFYDGTKYYNIQEKMCRVLREDTVNGKVCRLYISEEVDKEKYDEIVRINRVAEMGAVNMPAGFSSFANRLSESEGLNDVEKMPLPMKYKFYMLYEDETFEMSSTSIMKHLSSKEERKAFNAYIRSAEILFGNERSMRNVYETFFLNKKISE